MTKRKHYPSVGLKNGLEAKEKEKEMDISTQNEKNLSSIYSECVYCCSYAMGRSTKSVVHFCISMPHHAPQPGKSKVVKATVEELSRYTYLAIFKAAQLSVGD